MRTIDEIFSSIKNITSFCGERYLGNVYANSAKISAVLNMLSDEESKDAYAREIVFSVLINYLRGDLPASLSGCMQPVEWRNLIKRAHDENLYSFMEFPPNGANCMDRCKASTFYLDPYQYKDKINFKNEICLDLGACFGDTAIYLMEKGAARVYSFELDKGNVACMLKTFAKHKKYESITIVPKGVSDTVTSLFYQPDSNNPAAGRIINAPSPDAKGYHVECTTIDKWCEENDVKPTFIKMDIEGAEPAAIQGGVETFKKYRPQFVICIYHTWNQHFEIPLQLQKICADYEFYCKKSRPDCDVVLFAIPKEKATFEIVSSL